MADSQTWGVIATLIMAAISVIVLGFSLKQNKSILEHNEKTLQIMSRSNRPFFGQDGCSARVIINHYDPNDLDDIEDIIFSVKNTGGQTAYVSEVALYVTLGRTLRVSRFKPNTIVRPDEVMMFHFQTVNAKIIEESHEFEEEKKVLYELNVSYVHIDDKDVVKRAYYNGHVKIDNVEVFDSSRKPIDTP